MPRFRALATRLWAAVRAPRRPLAGMALCAGTGIALAEVGWRGGSPWLPLLAFLLTAGAWLRWRHVGLCWLTVAVGFGTLHVFRQQNVAARILAQRIGEGTRAVRVVGTVMTEPRARADANNARFTLTLERIAIDGGEPFAHVNRDHPVNVAVSWPLVIPGQRQLPPPPAWGDRIEIVGAARNLLGPRNPGEEDFAALARRRGIYSEILFGPDAGGSGVVQLPARDLASWTVRAARDLRNWMSTVLARDVREDPEIAAVIHSMILGLSTGAPGTDEVDGVARGTLGEALQETGTLHFFAVDGLKIGLLISVAVFGLRLGSGGMRREIAGAVAIPALVFYAFATGLGPASLRATVMAGALYLGLLRDRPTRAANNLGMAAVALFCWDTHQLFSHGFQLSFLVVAVILGTEPWLRERLGPVGAADAFLPRQLWPWWRRHGGEWARLYVLGLTGVSVAAWLGSLPLMIYWFHLVSPISVLANIVAFPLALGILVLGVLALGAALFSHAWSVLVNNANWLLAQWLITWVRLTTTVPGGYAYVGPPGQDFPRRPLAELTVFNLARGGSAAHLRAGGRDWLLDTGRQFDYEGIVRPALRARGVDRLDGLLLRQEDAAHAGAALLALTDFRPHRVWEPPRLARTVRSPTAREWRTSPLAQEHARACRVGSVFPVAPGVELRVLAVGDGTPGRTTDDRGLVVALRVAGARPVLFTGNAGRDTERWLLAQNARSLPADVLIVGTHRQGGTGGADFLRAVAPRLVLVQTDPARGAPAAHVTAALTDAEVSAALPGERQPQTFRTEREGAITLRLWPDRTEATGFVGGRTVTLTAR